MTRVLVRTVTATAWLFAATAAAAQAPPAEGAPPPSAAPSAGEAQKPADAQKAEDAQKPADAQKTAEGQKPDAAVPQGFTYSPEGRRDPFVSMLRRGTAQTGPRASGLAGLETAEVSLRGTVRSDGTYVGILQGVDARNYIARAGDKLRDGTIQAISADSMVILQQVNDPLSLVKQREVRKLLRQTEEAK